MVSYLCHALEVSGAHDLSRVPVVGFYSAYCSADSPFRGYQLVSRWFSPTGGSGATRATGAVVAGDVQQDRRLAVARTLAPPQLQRHACDAWLAHSCGHARFCEWLADALCPDPGEICVSRLMQHVPGEMPPEAALWMGSSGDLQRVASVVIRHGRAEAAAAVAAAALRALAPWPATWATNTDHLEVVRRCTVPLALLRRNTRPGVQAAARAAVQADAAVLALVRALAREVAGEALVPVEPMQWAAADAVMQLAAWVDVLFGPRGDPTSPSGSGAAAANGRPPPDVPDVLLDVRDRMAAHAGAAGELPRRLRAPVAAWRKLTFVGGHAIARLLTEKELHAMTASIPAGVLLRLHPRGLIMDVLCAAAGGEGGASALRCWESLTRAAVGGQTLFEAEAVIRVREYCEVIGSAPCLTAWPTSPAAQAVLATAASALALLPPLHWELHVLRARLLAQGTWAVRTYLHHSRCPFLDQAVSLLADVNPRQTDPLGLLVAEVPHALPEALFGYAAEFIAYAGGRVPPGCVATGVSRLAETFACRPQLWAALRSSARLSFVQWDRMLERMGQLLSQAPTWPPSREAQEALSGVVERTYSSGCGAPPRAVRRTRWFERAGGPSDPAAWAHVLSLCQGSSRSILAPSLAT
jgi:hypothetical protein